jgi:hypothetical protein
MSFPGIPHVMHPTRGWQQLLAAVPTTLDDLPKLTTATFIGIMVAITGNVLISLALNLQKLAHKRVEADTRNRRNEEQQNRKNVNDNDTSGGLEHRRSEGPSLDENEEDRLQASSPERSRQPSLHVETQGSIPFPDTPTPRNYGTRSNGTPSAALVRSTPIKRRTFASQFVPFRFGFKKSMDHENVAQQAPLLPVDIISEESILNGPSNGQKQPDNQKVDALEEGNETDYLKSKLWRVI